MLDSSVQITHHSVDYPEIVDANAIANGRIGILQSNHLPVGGHPLHLTLVRIVTFYLCLTLFIGVTNSWADGVLYRPIAEIAVYPKHSAPATAVSLNDSSLSSQLSAVVQRIDANVGAFVQSGDLLVTLDCADFDIALGIAEAQLESALASQSLAEAELERARALYNKKLSPKQDVDIKVAESRSSAAQVSQQRLNVTKAKTDVSRCTIDAPFSGVVTERLVSVGELAAVGTPLVSIIDSDELELSAFISASQAKAFSLVKSFTFDADGLYPVKLLNAGGIIDSRNRNFEVRFTFTGEKPRSGASGSLRWLDPIAHIPSSVVVRRGGQHGVFLANTETNRVTFHSLDQVRPGRPTAINLPLETLVVMNPTGLMNDGDQLIKN